MIFELEEDFGWKGWDVIDSFVMFMLWINKLCIFKENECLYLKLYKIKKIFLIFW